jgi:hypothetical protein
MMVENMNARQVTILQWLVIFLLAFLTFISAWSKVESAQTAKDVACLAATLPKEYVSYTRYITDRQDRTQEMLLLGRKIDSVDDKIDSIMKLLLSGEQGRSKR